MRSLHRGTLIFLLAYIAVPFLHDGMVVAQESERVRALKLSRYMGALVEEGRLAGGVTLLAHRGEIIHMKAVGMADREARKGMEEDSIFRIASMTKPMTTVAIMMLWESGELELDASVSKYIPAFKQPRVVASTGPLKTVPADSEITIRHLLTHTSGLGYTSSPTIGPMYVDAGLPSGLCTVSVSLEEYINRLATMPLAFNPGTRYQYGSSTDVLGLVVEKVSGIAFDRFMQEKICQPLGMNDTFFKLPEAKRSRLVAAYLPIEGGIRRLNDGEFVDYAGFGGVTRISPDYPIDPKHRCYFGGGGLCSTARDYFRFGQMLLNGGELNGVRLLRPDTVKMLVTDQIAGKDGFSLKGGFGLGFHILPGSDDVPEQLRGAFAWFGFWSTSFRISPRGDWVLVTMGQTAFNEKTMESFMEFEKLAAEVFAN